MIYHNMTVKHCKEFEIPYHYQEYRPKPDELEDGEAPVSFHHLVQDFQPRPIFFAEGMKPSGN